MQKNITLDLAQTSEVFGAFSDPTRLRILSLLAHNGELCVCDLMEVTGIAQAKISRHLATLRHAGIVTDRKDGQWVHYSIAKTNQPLHQQLVKFLKEAFKVTPELAKDLKKLQKSDCSTKTVRTIQIAV